MYSKVSFDDIHQIVKAEQGLDNLTYFEFYPIEKPMYVKTPDGEALITYFVKKHGKKVIVTFDNGEQITGIDSHLFIGADDERVKVSDLKIGDCVKSNSGMIAVSTIESLEEDIDVFDITVQSDNHLFLTANGIWHHNTGKTQTVETALENAGLKDGAGYFKITGSASPIGIYTALYKYRDKIILFDDCDGALDSQDGRNIIKAATDTKAQRKLVWGKKSSGMYDPDEDGPAKAKSDKKPSKDVFGTDEDEDEEIDDRIPRHFIFSGRIIFISNLQINKLDPDGALRTRAFLIAINPTPEEIFQRMGEILDSVKLEGGLSMTHEDRVNVLNVVKSSRKKSEASLRTLVRALNLAASGAPQWEKLVRLYC